MDALNDDGIAMKSEGTECPVQWIGTVDAHAAFFYARYQRWYLEIGASDAFDEYGLPRDVRWVIGADYGEPFQAGYMPAEEAAAFIRSAVACWRARGGASAEPFSVHRANGEAMPPLTAEEATAQIAQWLLSMPSIWGKR